MKKAPFIIIAIIALVALALIVDLTPSGDSAKAELLKISLFDGAAIRFHASRETVIAEFGQPDSVEVVGAEKLCYHDLPFCGDRAEVVFAIDQRTDQMITFNARIPCETEEEAVDLLPRIKERVKAQYPVIRRYFKTLEYANPTDNFYFENMFAYYFSVNKMGVNPAENGTGQWCVEVQGEGPEEGKRVDRVRKAWGIILLSAAAVASVSLIWSRLRRRSTH